MEISDALKFVGEKGLGGAISSPCSFLVSFGLQQLFPNASGEAKKLNKIQDTVDQIEKELKEGFKDIENELRNLEKSVDKKFRETLLVIEEQKFFQPVHEIRTVFERMQLEEDFALSNEGLYKIETNINMISDALTGGFSTGVDIGILERIVDLCSSRFEDKKCNSEELLKGCFIMETWLNQMMLFIIQGFLVMMKVYYSGNQEKKYTDFYNRFLENHLQPMLKKYQWCVEKVILNGLEKIPVKLQDKPAEGWSEMVKCMTYAFKRCDLFIINTIAHYTKTDFPQTLLTGRIIGTDWDLSQGKNRLDKLQEYISQNFQDLCRYWPRQTESEPFSRDRVLFGDSIPGQDSSRLMINNSSRFKILRYWMAGFPDKTVSLAGGNESPESHFTEKLFMENLAINHLGYYTSWEKGFYPVLGAVVPGTEIQPVMTRQRSEFILSLDAFRIKGDNSDTEDDFYQYDSLYDKTWQPQFVNSVQKGWNSQDFQPESPQNYDGFKNKEWTVFAVSLDGKHLLTASGEGEVIVWNTQSGEKDRTISAHTKCITCITVSPDGKVFATASYDKTVKIWELESGKEIKALPHQSIVNYVEFIHQRENPGNRQIITEDNNIRIWDVNSGKEVANYRKFNGQAAGTRIALAPEGHLFAVGYQDGSITVHHTWNGALINSARLNTDGQITNLVFTPDAGALIVTNLFSPVFRLLDIHNGLTLMIGSVNSDVESVAVSSDGRYVFTGGNSLSRWDLKTGEKKDAVFADGSVDGSFCQIGLYEDAVRLFCRIHSHNSFMVKSWDLNMLYPELPAFYTEKFPGLKNQATALPSTRTTSQQKQPMHESLFNQLLPGKLWIALETMTGYFVWHDNHQLRTDGEMNIANGFRTLNRLFSDPVNWSCFFRVIPGSNGKVLLQTVNGTYLRRNGDSGLELIADNFPDSKYYFTVDLVEGGMLELKTDDGKILTVPRFDVSNPLRLSDVDRGIVLNPSFMTLKKDVAESERYKCRFTPHFVNPGNADILFWNDGTALDSRHGYTKIWAQDDPHPLFNRFVKSKKVPCGTKAWYGVLIRDVLEDKTEIQLESCLDWDFRWRRMMPEGKAISGYVDFFYIISVQALKIKGLKATSEFEKNGQVRNTSDFEATALLDISDKKHGQYWYGEGKESATSGKDRLADVKFTLNPGESLWLKVSVLMDTPYITPEYCMAYFTFQFKDLRLSSPSKEPKYTDRIKEKKKIGR